VSLAPLLIGKEDFVQAIPLRSNLVEFSNKVEKSINRVALRFGPRQRGFLRRGCLWKGSVKNERGPTQIGTGFQPNHEPFTETSQYTTLIGRIIATYESGNRSVSFWVKIHASAAADVLEEFAMVSHAIRTQIRSCPNIRRVDCTLKLTQSWAIKASPDTSLNFPSESYL